MAQLTETVGQLKQQSSGRLPSQTERNPATLNVSMMYVNEFEVSDHVAMCDRIEKLLNEEPRREPIVPDEENKKNAGETLCRRPPVLTGDRPAIVSFAKHLTEVANEVCRRPPEILRARPLPAGDPLR